MSVRRNTVFGALGFLLPTAVVFLAFPLVLRHLGPASMGIYILAMSLSGSFAFLEFGLTTVTTKLVAEAAAADEPGRASDAVITSLAFYIALSAAGVVVLWLLSPTVARWAGAPDGAAATRVFRIAALLLLPAYVNNVAGSVLKGLHRFDVATAQATLLAAASWGGAVVVTLVPGSGIVPVAAAALVANMVLALASCAVTVKLCGARGIQLGRGRPRTRTLRSMFRFGMFMSLNGLVGVLVSQVQNLVMAHLLTPAAIAIWGTAVQIVSKINQLTSAAFEVVLPVSAEIGNISMRSDPRVRIIRGLYVKALGLSLLASVLASAILYAVAPALIRAWLRSPIDGEVSNVIRIACIGIAVNGATPVVFHFLNGIGRPEVNTASMGLGAMILYATLFSMTSNGLTVERFAIATSITLFVNGILYVAFTELVVWRRWLLPPASSNSGAAQA